VSVIDVALVSSRRHAALSRGVAVSASQPPVSRVTVWNGQTLVSNLQEREKCGSAEHRRLVET